MTEATSTERISEAEQAVMHVLWDEAPLSATQIAARIPDDRSWTLATIKTLISRLVGNNALAAKPDGRRFLYSPLITRHAMLEQESQLLVNRHFGGRAGPLFAHLAEREALTAQDIAEIEALIARMKK